MRNDHMSEMRAEEMANGFGKRTARYSAPKMPFRESQPARPRVLFQHSNGKSVTSFVSSAHKDFHPGLSCRHRRRKWIVPPRTRPPRTARGRPPGPRPSPSDAPVLPRTPRPDGIGISAVCAWEGISGSSPGARAVACACISRSRRAQPRVARGTDTCGAARAKNVDWKWTAVGPELAHFGPRGPLL